MNLAELGNLDPAKVGSWPLPVRMLIFVVICILLLGAGFYFDTRNQLDELAQVERKGTRSSRGVREKAAQSVQAKAVDGLTDADETGFG